MQPSHYRKSQIAISEIYFWAGTIHKWMYLMEDDSNKKLIVDYIKKPSDEGLITVYAFVIMPNHIHLVWLTKQTQRPRNPKKQFT